MKHPLLSVMSLLLLLPLTASAQDKNPCSCTPYPFTPDPPCLNRCASKFVRGYSASEVFEILDVAPRTALGIRSFQDNEGQAASLSDILQPDDVADLRRAFDEADKQILNNMLLELFGS